MTQKVNGHILEHMFDPRVSFPSPPDGGDVVEVRLGRGEAVRRLAVAVGGLDALVGLDAGADDEWGEVVHAGDVNGGGVPAGGGAGGDGAAAGVAGGRDVEAAGRVLPDGGDRDPMAWVWSPAVGAADEFVLAGLAQ